MKRKHESTQQEARKLQYKKPTVHRYYDVSILCYSTTRDIEYYPVIKFRYHEKGYYKLYEETQVVLFWKRWDQPIFSKQSLAIQYGFIEYLKSVPWDNSYYDSSAEDLVLDTAAECGQLDIVNLAIEKGATNFNSALYGACYRGRINVVHLMLEKGATAFNDCLYGACRRGHLEIAKLILDKGATNLNECLYAACGGDHVEVVKLLIEKGATECWSCRKPLQEHLDK
jgi:hypothetical protein